MICAGLLFAASLSITRAQNLGIPSTWRDSTNTLTSAQLQANAQNAINGLLAQLGTGAEFNGIGYWQSGNVFSVMANQDHWTGNTTNQASVTSNLNTAYKLYANYDQFGWWATAAVYAYRAYGDNGLLATAEATWNHVTNYVITPADAQAGKQPNKDFPLAGSCNGTSMVGGVFWRPTSDDTTVNSITTGLYTTLSAFLAEITKNSTYLDAATQSANWIQTQNLSPAKFVLDTVDGQTCARSPANELFTYNSGKFIEGLSILSDLAPSAPWKSLMTSIISATVESPPWQGSDGIITEGATSTSNNDGVGFKAIFIRGLLEALVRDAGNEQLVDLVGSYINVQNNALTQLAATGNAYAVNWHGPPQPFTSWGQLAAIDVLTAAYASNEHQLDPDASGPSIASPKSALASAGSRSVRAGWTILFGALLSVALSYM